MSTYMRAMWAHTASALNHDAMNFAALPRNQIILLLGIFSGRQAPISETA